MPDVKKRDEGRNTLYCSFCGKSQHEVRKLIAGPTVFICDECIILCLDIIIAEGVSVRETAARQARALLRDQAAGALVRGIKRIIERENKFHRPYAEELKRVLGFYEKSLKPPSESKPATIVESPEPSGSFIPTVELEPPAPGPKPVLDTIIRVDRSVYPHYPEWMEKVMHPELEEVGPTEYDLATIELWLHDDQKKGVTTGNRVHDHLIKTDTLKTCLGLRDGEEIMNKGIEIFRMFFGGKAVFLWKSTLQLRVGNIFAPYLIEYEGEVVLRWLVLIREHWGCNLPAARFAS